MDILVDQSVMQPAVYEVDDAVTERKEEQWGKHKVQIAVLRRVGVHLSVAELHCYFGRS